MWEDCSSWIDFCEFYVVVEWKEDWGTEGSWRSATCTCCKFTGCGVCQHIIAMYLRSGGLLTESERELETVKGFSASTGKRTAKVARRARRPIILSEIPAVSQFFPNVVERQMDRPAIGEIYLDESEAETSETDETPSTAARTGPPVVEEPDTLSNDMREIDRAETGQESEVEISESEETPSTAARTGPPAIEVTGSLSVDLQVSNNSTIADGRTRRSRNRAPIDYVRLANGY